MSNKECIETSEPHELIKAKILYELALEVLSLQ